MAKKDNLLGFRAPTEEAKNRVKRDAEFLGMSLYELVEAGIKAERQPNTRQDLEYRRRNAIYERDRLITEVQAQNRLIEAFNRQLKDKYPDRYSDLSEEYGTLYVYDKDGNRLF